MRKRFAIAESSNPVMRRPENYSEAAQARQGGGIAKKNRRILKDPAAYGYEIVFQAFRNFTPIRS
jgi:hypothetical protein